MWLRPYLANRGFLVSCDWNEEIRKIQDTITNRLLVGSGSLGGGLETLTLLNFALRAILVEELEELGGGVLVESVAELSDRGRDLCLVSMQFIFSGMSQPSIACSK